MSPRVARAGAWGAWGASPWRRVRVVAGLLLCAVLLLPSCRPPSDGGGSAGGGTADGGVFGGATERSLEVELVDAPRVGEARVRVRVLQAGEPVAGARVEVTGDMTHAGMAPVTAEAVPSGDAYETEGFAFSMAGDWILTVAATYPDGTIVRQTVPLNVPGG